MEQNEFHSFGQPHLSRINNHEHESSVHSSDESDKEIVSPTDESMLQSVQKKEFTIDNTPRNQNNNDSTNTNTSTKQEHIHRQEQGQ